MKKALVLGAGTYQVPLIRKSKERGFHTIVVSVAGNYPGFALADKPYFINTVDCDAIVRLAQEEMIDCVCTTGTDVAMQALGAVCDQLGLPGITEEAGILATNKREMKLKFDAGGVRTAHFREVDSLEQLRVAFDLLAKPVICKAVDTSGSRGIIKVNTVDQLPEAFRYARGASQKNYILIEEYIQGVEFGAQAAVIEGELQFVMLHGDILHHGKTDIPVGHYVPYSVPAHVEEDAKRQIKLAVKALGLSTCVINADFVLRGDQVYVLEIGARGGATCLPELVSTYYDMDYYGYILDLSLGLKPQMEFKPKFPCGNLLIKSASAGTLEGFEINGDHLDIVEVVHDYKPGDKVPAFQLGPDRLGHVVIRGADDVEVLHDLKVLENNIKVILRS